MKRIFIIVITNFIFFASLAQNIDQIDLIKGSWVVLGDIDKVLLNDTIGLKRVSNYMPESSTFNPGYLYSFPTLTTDLYFEKDGKLILNYYRVGNHSENKYKWRIDTKSQTINIDIVGKSKNKFRLVNSTETTEKCTAYVGSKSEKIFYDAKVQTIILKKI